MSLFTIDQLAHYLQVTHDPGKEDNTVETGGDVDEAGSAELTTGTYTVIEAVVTGWLLDATGLTTFPDRLPPQVFSWALELAAIAYENPAAAAAAGTDRVTNAYTEQRREAILARAARWAAKVPTAPQVAAPVGDFPCPGPWPTDLEPPRRLRGWC
ncbi:hypothetical protein G9U51_08305 [Calidifontibacter sp. DB0510]|uniref:Uncharacterized protein n=1 Tax=Metallococcus carri TaxID=1656884 RepID=A0A967B0F1_9MICO|nr:hypothetical protein [Metallococcus carri]NHN55777.1 hypothetical protein [Metallococcus carri]NOP38534.1 hypothetical protein [Calidifontibacter sp. DB2511S]